MGSNPTVNNNKSVNNANFSQISFGAKRTDMKTAKQQSIFDTLDTNKNGVIDNKDTSVVSGKVKNAEGKIVEKQYIKLKDLPEGRSLVMDSNGKQWVRAKDGTILKADYAKYDEKSGKVNVKKQPQRSQYNVSKDKLQAINSLIKSGKLAKADVDKQLAQDGWAGDIADGVSKLWNNKLGEKLGINTENTASQVREFFQKHDQNMKALKSAAQKGDAEFEAEFKKIYGKQYSKEALKEIQDELAKRSSDYVQSQQTGATVVKTSAKIGAGVAVGVATGGTGFVALGAAAAATTAASVAIEESDRAHITGHHTDSSGKTVKDKGTFREGTDHAKIMKDAAIDGVAVLAGGAVGKAAQVAAKGRKYVQLGTNVAGDVATGAVQEKIQTGEVTLTGTLMNAGMSGVGSAASTGLLKNGVKAIKKSFGKDGSNTSKKFSISKSQIPKTFYDKDGNMIAGGFFGKKHGPSLKERIFGVKLKDSAKTMEEHIQDGFNNQNVIATGKKVVSKKVIQAKNLNITEIKELDNISPSQISAYAKEGEVCAIGNKLYVNSGGQSIEVKLSREKFNELFPPEGFARIEQNGLNNCWLVSRLNSMTGSSYGRAELYSMLEETASGDILVHLKNGKPIKFPGGKPVDTTGARLGDGASPGVEMIHQAVLVKVMQGADKGTDNIAHLSASKLSNETGALRHSDIEASRYLLGANTINKVEGKAQIQQALENFDSNRDMGTATWGVHARSVVDYNQQTQMVTYHDPYAGGIDLTCSLDEFVKLQPQVVIRKPKNSGGSFSNTASSEMNLHEQNTISRVKPKEITSTSTASTFNSKTTELTNRPLIVARTVEGNPIGASITNTNVIVIKDGKRTAIPIPKIGDTMPIHETSTDTYLIVKNDNGKIFITTSKTPDLPISKATNQTMAASVSTNSVPQKHQVELNYGKQSNKANNSKTSETSAPVPNAKPQLEIPSGAKYIDTVEIFGKPRRRIQMPNGEYLTEINGKWKKL